ncbi:MAG: FkbM family methyltransferase [Hyphomicrobiaceae bacterium]|nr:FkbM family methyltransferase [Hyphomicrobiaceae bacterium]
MLPPPNSLIKMPVLKRLLPSIWKRYMWMAQRQYFIESRMGFLHLIDQSNSIDRNLVTKGVWEGAQIDYFSGEVQSFLDRGKSVEFWDIGSHAGLYSIYLAKHCQLETIHAFEPDPRSHAQLHANLFINELTAQIEVHKVAATDKNGKLDFYMARCGNRGASRIAETGTEEVIGKTVVEAVRLDDYLKPSHDILALKIDVEEHELQVFDGMLDIIKKNKIFLQLEIFEENRSKMLPYLEDKGFKCVKTIVFDNYFTNFDLSA